MNVTLVAAASMLATANAASVFTLYPGFIEPKFAIQAVSDKGPILEMIISCKPGEGIISFSKIDRAFCVPDATCYPKLKPAIRHLCR